MQARTQKNKATSYHCKYYLLAPGTVIGRRRAVGRCLGGVLEPALTSFRLSFAVGQLKAKLAKLKRELVMPSSGGGGGGIGFDVARTGIASVGFMCVFPFVCARPCPHYHTRLADEIDSLQWLPVSGQIEFDERLDGNRVGRCCLRVQWVFPAFRMLPCSEY